MGKYKVEITETYQHQEIIEAKNEEDAISILKRKYSNEELILNEENYITTEFDVIERMKIKDYQTR